MTTLRLILGDQLNHNHSWFQNPQKGVHYLMMEMRQETDYVTHHIQKVCAFFLAMRRFAGFLENQGFQVHYLKLDDPGNAHALEENLDHLLKKLNCRRFEWQLPDEWRLDQQLREFFNSRDLAGGPVDSEHFLTTRDELEAFFAGKKQYLMENFYRSLRRRENILMEGKDPVGGRWNYDAENRKAYDGSVPFPQSPKPENDVSAIVRMLDSMEVRTLGNIDPEKLNWPVDRSQAEAQLEWFCSEALPHFGTFQDALTEKDPFLFHSRLSFALNSKILHPREVIERALKSWEANPEAIGLAQIEGFIRQILGWREYMRGIYWAKMPKYRSLNHFRYTNKLPDFFWTGKTKMRCVGQAVRQSLDHAYAHHIQRLMVTGNFAMLAGINPDEVDRWYLGIYIDAVEWVELPNTRGMSQYADGGLLASKPYAASANYLNKMGDHCKHCDYDPKKRVGEKACPFNSFYWAFLEDQREKLGKNPRLGNPYRTWERMDPSLRNDLMEQAKFYREHLEEL